VLDLLGGLKPNRVSRIAVLSDTTGSRCRSSSSSFWHHRGVGEPSEG
jgi:hypothetical protein